MSAGWSALRAEWSAVEVVGGVLRIEARPQEGGDLLPMEAVPLGHGEELHEARRLFETPFAFPDDP